MCIEKLDLCQSFGTSCTKAEQKLNQLFENRKFRYLSIYELYILFPWDQEFDNGGFIAHGTAKTTLYFV
jgi:hypothetical protein